MSDSNISPPSRPRGLRLISLQEERMERKLLLAFGFMSFVPLLIVFWWRVTQDIEVEMVIYLMIASSAIGYVIVRRMFASVLHVSKQASAVSSGGVLKTIEVSEGNEIGELARAFNRITRELEGKIHELESSRQLVKKLLSRIGTAIISYESIDNLLNLIVENTVGSLEAQMGSLLLVDGETQELVVKTTWSEQGEETNGHHRVKLGEGIAGWVAKEGRPFRGLGRAAELGLTLTQEHEGMVLAVPLKLREHAMGVLSIFRSDRTRAFTDDDESLAGNISSQIAVAIENYRLNLDIEQTYIETIMALAMAVEAKDPYSAGHSKRVAFYAVKAAEQLGLDEEAARLIHAAGVLHDIGKIGIRDEILLKPTPLTHDEERLMEQHPLIGEAILKPVRSLQKAMELVRCHHEFYDGTGYPAGLKGDAIPLGARILTVADSYDAMVTDRPYRKRLSLDAARAELTRYASIYYDPEVVDAFFRYLDEKDKRRDTPTGSELPTEFS